MTWLRGRHYIFSSAPHNKYIFITFLRKMQEKAQVPFGEYLGSAAASAYEGFQPGGDYGTMFGDMVTHAQYACYARAIARYVLHNVTSHLVMVWFIIRISMSFRAWSQGLEEAFGHWGHLTRQVAGLGIDSLQAGSTITREMSHFWKPLFSDFWLRMKLHLNYISYLLLFVAHLVQKYNTDH